MTTAPKPVSSMTAWERWELASFDEAASTTGGVSSKPDAVPPAPTFSAVEIAQLREDAKREGYESGHQTGLEEGLAEGRAKGEAEALKLGNDAAEALLAVAAKLDQQLAELDQTVAEEIVALAAGIAHQVVSQAVALKPETIISVVREALTHLPLQHAAIYLHPDDASLTRSYAGEQLSHAGHRIHENAKLARGDVMIEVGGSQIDASLATRWRRVLATIGQDTPWLADDKDKEPA
jgi:flagellar assembly protein FliH